MSMIILLDMDGVIADTDAGFVAAWEERYNATVPFDVYDRTQFFMNPEEDALRNSSEANAIFSSQGFFSGLRPKEGALEAITQMQAEGHSVFILTSAGIRYPLAASEKYEWVSEYFGPEMISRLIITPAKHMVRGDFLIDDRPKLPFTEEAEWEHILFDASYNQHIQSKKRLNWTNWKEILEL